MARFIHYDENDDGTITFTSNALGEDNEVTSVISLNFDEMVASMVGMADMDKAEEFVNKNTVRIPNNTEGAEEG